MIGAIIGDIIGSRFEEKPIKSKQFDLFSEDSVFTDDTVLTVALADAIINHQDYATMLIRYAAKYYNAGFSSAFLRWVNTNRNRPNYEIKPYISCGNGAVMRISPIGWAFNSIDRVLQEADKAAFCSHNHPEAVKGAKAIAHSIYLARRGNTKERIKRRISESYGYNLDRPLDEIRQTYKLNVTCVETVPESIISFLESEDYPSAIRNAISLGRDSDTMACMAGAIAEAYYDKIPDDIVSNAKKRLPEEFLNIIDQFKSRNPQKKGWSPSNSLQDQINLEDYTDINIQRRHPNPDDFDHNIKE